MKAFTDCLVAPGQAEGEVVEVEMLAYDRNKYVTIRAGSALDWLKCGYLFADKNLTQRFNRQQWFSLPAHVDAPKPSRQAVVKELKALRQRSTRYTVWWAVPVTEQAAAESRSPQVSGEFRKKFRSLHAALQFLSAKAKMFPVRLQASVSTQTMSVHCPLLEFDTRRNFFLIGARERHAGIPQLNTKHYKKYFKR